MRYFFTCTIFIVGLSGIIAQAVSLRELLVAFYGNELTLGIILANWLISEVAGVFILGKFIDRLKNRITFFVILEITFSLALPASIYLARTFKNVLGIPPGEGIGLWQVFLSSLLILFPIAFSHGALFGLCCKIYPLLQRNKESNSSIRLRLANPVCKHADECGHSALRLMSPQRVEGGTATTVKSWGSIGKAYAWETIGTIIGAILLTYLFIPFFKSFQITFFITLGNLITCYIFLSFLKKMKSNGLKYGVLSIIIFLAYLSWGGLAERIEAISVKKQWKNQDILEYRNSIYGNIAVTKQFEQYTFFYNGLPIITVPYPDISFVQDFAHFPLLFHKQPKDILVIGSGAGGLINEILKHAVRKIDYTELDPLLIDMLKKYPSALTLTELSDTRVNIINLDGRFFIRQTANKYDVILIGLSKPQDLSTNRFFTGEFFSSVKNRLNQDGIMAFWLPGSLVYLSQELKDINACIFKALRAVFDFVRIIPGDYNIFLASSCRDILDIDAALISQRISDKVVSTEVEGPSRRIDYGILNPSYVSYRLDKKWVDWFMLALNDAKIDANSDLKPVAVYQMLILWNKKFSPFLSYLLVAFRYLDLKIIFAFVVCLSLLLFCLFRSSGKRKFALVYNIATTGFFAMLINLVLIFSFQIFYGYLYYRIGILISAFMAGIALGSIVMSYSRLKAKNTLRLFFLLEVMIIIFSYAVAFIINRFPGLLYSYSLIFLPLFFVCGLLAGLEFPLASKIFMDKEGRIGEVLGLLYGSDLIGGLLAGILAGAILLPVLGIFNTCMLVIMLKLSSLILLYLSKPSYSLGSR